MPVRSGYHHFVSWNEEAQQNRLRKDTVSKNVGGS